MNTKRCFLLLLLLVGLISGCGISEEQQRQEVFEFANVARDPIINKFYNGGTNNHLRVDRYFYNSYSDSYEIEATITFNGTWRTQRIYEAQGTLVANRKTGKIDWSASWHSPNLQAYLDESKKWEFIAGTAVVAVAAYQLSTKD